MSANATRALKDEVGPFSTEKAEKGSESFCNNRDIVQGLQDVAKDTP